MKRVIAVASVLLLGSFLISGCMSGGLVHGSGPRVVHESSRGKLTVNYKHTEKELGVPFYPGSKPVNDGSMDMEVQGLNWMMQALTTEDSLEKVKAFYIAKLGQPEPPIPGLTDPNELSWSYHHSNGASQSVRLKGGVDNKPVVIVISVMIVPQEGM